MLEREVLVFGATHSYICECNSLALSGNELFVSESATAPEVFGYIIDKQFASEVRSLNAYAIP